MGNMVIVSNRLPVSVKKTDAGLEFYASVGGLATGLSSYTQRPGTKWIGWPGLACDGLTEAEKTRIRKQLKKHRCYPVFLTQKQIDDFYNGYSNSVLWPLFHDLPVRAQSKRQWQAYQQVNQQFTDEVLGLSAPGSTIWVHDYQLQLMPELLRRADRRDQIGFFLHIPFPSAKAMHDIPEARMLLEGTLGADLVGFHTRGYSRNFLDTCDRVLGTGHQEDFVAFSGRTVRVTEFPMGIDYARFAATTKHPNNRLALHKLRQHYRGKKVILTVDRLDPSKGLVERLGAFRQLLRQHPGLAGRVVMVMIVAPSRTDIPEYAELKRQLDQLVQSVNKEFATPAWQPVEFKYESMPLETIVLYYQVADIAFIAPIRDGMNLVAKEFLASKPKHNGVLILSETAGAAEELQDAIQVNPAKPKTLVEGLSQALTLPQRELQNRAKRMRRHIETFTVQHWAASFMGTLQKPRGTKAPLVRTVTDATADNLITSYRKAGKRLIILGYDGVLRELARTPADATPTKEILQLLKKLSNNQLNEVLLASGRDKQDLGEWFGNLPIALAAEHGAFFRRAGGKNWHRTSHTDNAWIRRVRDLFNYFVGDTPGSMVEQKNDTIAWHYRNASPYRAQKNLVTMRRLLKPLLKEYGLSENDGKKVLEIHPSDIGKGRVAQEWLIHDHDFVLAIGDDTTDEDIFRTLPASAYSIKVGRGATAAQYRLKSVADVLDLLDRL